MTAPLAPGDFVEAILNDNDGIGGTLQKGTIYEVASLGQPHWGGRCTRCAEPEGHEFLFLCTNPSTPWCPTSFRPIYRPKAELIEGLLKSDVLRPAIVRICEVQGRFMK